MQIFFRHIMGNSQKGPQCLGLLNGVIIEHFYLVLRPDQICITAKVRVL